MMRGKESIFCGGVTEERVEHSGWGWHCCCFALLVLSHPRYDGSSRGDRVMEAAEVTGQQTAAWAPEDGSLAGRSFGSCTHLCCSTTQITVPAHWLLEERNGYIFLNHPTLTSELAVWPKLNQQICWGPTAPNVDIYFNKLYQLCRVPVGVTGDKEQRSETRYLSALAD